MIPKTLHYCWFGNGKKSELVQKCIQSWKKAMPDYTIIEWNESNSDITANKYISEAYSANKWAFVSDYIRLRVLFEYGGIYLDTDVETLKSFDAFLNNEAFTGFESNDSIITAVIGAEKNNAFLKTVLDAYAERSFIKEDGSFDMTTNVTFISKFFLENGLKPNGKEQDILGFRIYPQAYFSPNNFLRILNRIPAQTYSIHHFEGSWNDKSNNSGNFVFRCRRYLVGTARNLIGTDNLSRLKRK